MYVCVFALTFSVLFFLPRYCEKKLLSACVCVCVRVSLRKTLERKKKEYDGGRRSRERESKKGGSVPTTVHTMPYYFQTPNVRMEYTHVGWMDGWMDGSGSSPSD